MSQANNESTSRRTIIQGAAVLVGSIAPVLALAAIAPDPIYAAIESHKRLVAASETLSMALANAEDEIRGRPSTLIAWRKYGAIGGSEIERARDKFLTEPGADRWNVMQEYRHAKRAERENYRAGAEWDRRHGLRTKRREEYHAEKAALAAQEHLSQLEPTTVAGAGALAAYCVAQLQEYGQDLDYEYCEWMVDGLANVATSLKKLGGGT
jgi:hypothetical protein